VVLFFFEFQADNGFFWNQQFNDFCEQSLISRGAYDYLESVVK